MRARCARSDALARLFATDRPARTSKRATPAQSARRHGRAAKCPTSPAGNLDGSHDAGYVDAAVVSFTHLVLKLVLTAPAGSFAAAWASHLFVAVGSADLVNSPLDCPSKLEGTRPLC
jgi:hypothetical protein